MGDAGRWRKIRPPKPKITGKKTPAAPQAAEEKKVEEWMEENGGDWASILTNLKNWGRTTLGGHAKFLGLSATGSTEDLTERIIEKISPFKPKITGKKVRAVEQKKGERREKIEEKWAEDAAWEAIASKAKKIRAKKVQIEIPYAKGPVKVWVKNIGSGLAVRKQEEGGVALTHIETGLRVTEVPSDYHGKMVKVISDDLGFKFEGRKETGDFSTDDAKQIRRIIGVVTSGNFDSLSEKEKNLLISQYAPVAKTAVKADLVLDRFDLDPKVTTGMGSKEGLAVIRRLVREFSDFKDNPVFTVEEGRLVLEDGYKFVLEPEIFNLEPGDLKGVSTVGINLEDLGIKKALVPKVEEEEGGTFEAHSSEVQEAVDSPKKWQEAFKQFWSWYAPFSQNLTHTKTYRRYMKVGGLFGKEIHTQLQQIQGEVESDLMVVYQALADLNKLIPKTAWAKKKKFLGPNSLGMLEPKQRAKLGRLLRQKLKSIPRIARDSSVPEELIEPIERIRKHVDGLNNRILDLLLDEETGTGLIDDPDFTKQYGENILDVMMKDKGLYFTRTFELFDHSEFGEKLFEEKPTIKWRNSKTGKVETMLLVDAFKQELRGVDFVQRVYEKEGELKDEDARQGVDMKGYRDHMELLGFDPAGKSKEVVDARRSYWSDYNRDIKKEAESLTPALPEEELDGMVRKILNPKRAKATLVRKTMGRVDMNIFIARKLHNKKLHVLLRKMMGEYRDQLDINAVRTVERMSSLLGQVRAQNYLMEMAKKEKWVHVKDDGKVSTVAISTRDEVPDIYIDSMPDHPEFGPFRGVYVKADFMEALQDQFGAGYGHPSPLQGAMNYAVFRVYGKAMGAARAAKTLFSTTVQIRNWLANGAISVVHGHVPMHWTVGEVLMKTFPEAYRVTREAHFRAGKFEDDKYKVEGKTVREFVRELMKLNVIFDSPSDELADMIQASWNVPVASLLEDGPSVVGAGIIETAKEKLRRGVTKGFDFAAAWYRSGDDFWKVLGYVRELKAMREAFPDVASVKSLPKDKGWPALVGSSKEAHEKWVKDTTALRIRDIYPTFSNAPNWVKAVRWFPITGTFPTYFAELIRTQYIEFFIHLNRDLKSGNKVLVKRATARAVKWTLANVASGVVIKSLWDLLILMLPGFSPLGGDDEEKMRDLLAPWSENSTILGYKNDKTGEIYTVDLSYMLPFSRPKDAYRAIVRGKTAGSKVGGAIMEIGGDILTADMVYNKLTEAWYGETREGRKVFEKEDPARDRWMRSVLHAWGAWEPGIVTTSLRTVMAAGDIPSFTGRKYSAGVEVVAAFSGQRLTKMDPPFSFSFKAKSFSRNLRTDKGKVETFGRSEFAPPFGFSGSVKQLEARLPLAEKVRQRHFSEMHNAIDTARAFGMSGREIREALKNEGINQEIREALMRGWYIPYEPSDNMRKQILLSYAGQEKLAMIYKHRAEAWKKEMARRKSGTRLPGTRPQEEAK